MNPTLTRSRTPKAKVPRYLLRVAYDGTDFAGYQRQPGLRTVQTTIETALAAIWHQPIATTAAGRTDAGVHARRQYVGFHAPDRRVPRERIARAVNTHLPDDVRVTAARPVGDDFHARYDATLRHYRYYLAPVAVLEPHCRRYVWRVREDVDPVRMQHDADALEGCHDFATFAAAGAAGDHVRRVAYARVLHHGARIVFAIGADGFLWKMVRSIVGSLVEREVARLRGAACAPLAQVLAATDRTLAGTTAPPHGLFLHEVDYTR